MLSSMTDQTGVMGNEGTTDTCAETLLEGGPCAPMETPAVWKLSTIYVTQLNEEEVQVNNTHSLKTSPAPGRGEGDPDAQTRDTVPLV